VVSDGVVSSRELTSKLPAGVADTLAGFIRECQSVPTLAAQLKALAAELPTRPLGDLNLLPCIPAPGKVVCLGVNYVDHAKEGGNVVADYPTLFLRCDTSLLAHGAPLRVPSISSKLDFEAELAVVIGRPMRFVVEEQALAHVFGYACFNDATLRDYQKRTSQWTIGKNFDGTGGFGPWLVTADELPPGCTGLHIESRLNGQVMQSANTSDMVFGVARTLALLSECLTLEPGDVVVMGTPAGVGYARTPPVWMKAGDTIEIEIEGLGVLCNPVVS
jgi:2-keto-4-pentenoate hydratase/2-oxohepta-3-ene-1,7-dioic acid hydratase in catechol pathway